MTPRKHSQSNTPSLLVPSALRRSLQAVVVDANAYGAVGPDLANLDALSRDLNEIGINTWVPEPVAWEWAEHLAAQWTVASTAVNAAARHLRRAGLLPVLRLQPDYPDRAALISAFLSRLSAMPHVEIIQLTGASAVEGLKDQILLRSPAKTKSDRNVKTGGSDSAWLRDVIAKANGAAEQLLFLSQDSDVKQAYAEWGHEPPLMRSAQDIRASLFEYLPASIEDAWLVTRYLVDRLPLDLDPASGADSVLVGASSGLLEALDIGVEEDREFHVDRSARLTNLTASAGVDAVTFKQPESDDVGDAGDAPVRTLMATAFFLADAEVTTTYRDADSGEVTTAPTWTKPGMLVRTRQVLEVQDQTITGVRPDSDAVVFRSSGFAEPWEALADLGEALTAVPGLTLPDDWGDWKDGTDQNIAIDGTNEVIDLHWSHGDWGGLDLRLGDHEVSVTCHYDDSVWIGGKDGIEAAPPYYLSTEGDMDTVGGGAWDISAWIIARLAHPGHQIEPDA